MKKDIIIYILLIGIILFLFIRVRNFEREANRQLDGIEMAVEKDMKTTVIYQDQTIESLKKENKDLYDSLKRYKKEIDYLVKFKYQKNYRVDTIFIRESENDILSDEIRTFTYASEPNDTLQYELNIGSRLMPNWYNLNISVSDEFTLVNKKNGTLNTLDIESSGLVTDVIVINQPTKRKFIDRFAVGPSISVGYNPFSKDIDMTIGFSVTYDLLGK